MTGNGSLGGVVLDEPDELLELVEVELGQALLAGEELRVIDGHDRASAEIGNRARVRTEHTTPHRRAPAQLFASALVRTP